MMQLATNQRPHPPPVPPRPSRQVVAEALKRSPRPPYPTRQAPPPPNTKPWRSDDPNANKAQSGRTVIYESVKETSNHGEFRSSSEPRSINNETSKNGDELLSRRRSNDEIIGRCCKSSNSIGLSLKEYRVEEKMVNDCDSNNQAKSERYEAENNRERQNKLQRGREKKSQLSQLRSNREEFCDRENSTVSTKFNDDAAGPRRNLRRSIAYDSGDNEPANSENIATTDVGKMVPTMIEKNFENDNAKIGTNDIWGNGDDVIPKNFEGEKKTLFNELANEIIAETIENERTHDYFDTDETKDTGRCSTLAKNSDSHGSNTYADTGASNNNNTPTGITKKRNVTGEKDVHPRNTKDETIRAVENREHRDDIYGNKTTISSDDCTTVVVIDEPERKISFNDDNDNIHHQDWLEAGIRYSSTKITLPGDETNDRADKLSHSDDDPDRDDDRNDTPPYNDHDFARIRERIAMSTLQGLPPLPRSLSGFNLNEGRREAAEPPPPPTRSSSKTPKNIKSTQPSSSRPSPPGRQLTTLDTQLAILRKEMFGLRQLDLSLLSQLWSLNESIQEFRQLLQEQEDRAPSPSPSSEEGEDISYGSHPPPPPRRPAPLLHHHRPPRPPRPLRPPASDESPSSEEYGGA